MEKNLFNKYGKVICVFLLAEVLGIVFCNLLGIGRISKLNFTVNIPEKREFAKMLFDVLIDKTKIFVVLSVISASVFYKYIPILVAVYFGFSYGVIACILSAFLGIWYYAVIFFAVISHMALYGYSIYILNGIHKGKWRYPAAYVVMIAGADLESGNYSFILYEILGK